MSGSKAVPGKANQKWYSKLWLVTWKNLLLRKRHWILTTFELLLPTLLFALLVVVRVVADSTFAPTIVDQPSIFKPLAEDRIRFFFCSNTGGFLIYDEGCDYETLPRLVSRKFLWGPPNNFTSNLVKRVQSDINFLDDDLQSVQSNEELNDLIGSLYLQSNESFTSFFVGLFVHGVDENTTDPPEQFKYDLRFQKYWFTDLEYPFLQIPGPRNYTSYYSNLGSYNEDGFTFIQTLVDRHYTAIVSGDESVPLSYSMETQMYPYPPYIQDNGTNQIYGSSIPTFVVLSLILLSPALIKGIVHEKETGVRELVQLMGLERWLIWLGWFLNGFFMILFITIIMTIFLKIEITPADVDYLPPILNYTDGFYVWMMLFLYGISSIMFCFAISCFFKRPTLATTIGILAWLMSYSLPRTFMYARYDDMDLAPKIISCFLPNMAIVWGFRIIAMFEGRAVGVQWDNVWDTGNPRDELTPAMILIMLFVDIILYFLITWYFDQVLPGPYGVAQPWSFPFKKSYWKPEKVEPRDSFGSESSSSIDLETKTRSNNFEAEPTNMKAGIVIKHLRKEFPALGGGTKVAVKEVNLSCYEGQCTVLLGHNGAGKTTTMSVITGVYPATGGTAVIQGYDINTHLKQARSEVGLCPQHNTLFADLSVEEHLLFFAQLKGSTRKEAQAEAKELMARMQLTEKMDQFGNQLSGGMKRKLCLCIALVGGSKIVILDEPSSGLDPESRRWVWNVIQRERGSRTVLVTTHHMEEADVLGDRIAIMADGEVVCSGSTLFLKRKFGDGYSLRVLPRKSCDIHMLSTTIKTVIPEASLTSTTEEELIYSLPDDSSCFATLLDTLSSRKEHLKINHVGISLTTMEQVFLKVGEILHSSDGSQSKEHLANANSAFDASTTSFTSAKRASKRESENYEIETSAYDRITNIDTRLTGSSLVWERLKTLWLKHWIYTRRKWVLLLTQGLIPVLVTLMCLLVDAAFFGDNAAEPARELSLNMFEWTQSYVQSDSAYLSQCYMDQFYSPYKVEETDNVTATLFYEGETDVFHYRENDVTSALFQREGTSDSKTLARMLYQSIPYHAPGVGINLISNAVLQSETNSSTFSISAYNYPLPQDKRYRLEDGSSSSSAFIYSLVMPTAMAFLSASFLIFPLQERESKTKQIQLMTGTSSAALWFTTFTWDLLSYSFSFLIMFALFMIIDAQGNFTLEGAPGALFLLMLMYGWSGLPMAYIFSYPFSSPASGFAILAMFNIVAAMIISIATWSLNYSGQPSLMTLSAVLGNVSSFIPSYPVALGFRNLIQTSAYNTQCDIVDSSLVNTLCASLIITDPTSPFLPCCPQCDNLPGNKTCFKTISYLQWDAPGMGVPLTWLLFDGILFFVIIALIEIGVGRRVSDSWSNFWNKVGSKNKQIWRYTVPEDDDVLEEARLAKALMMDDNPEAALVVTGLTKVFPAVGLTAVNDINFKVNKGECFGLLGVNGAGKTTTFRMLTGDETPTAGDARIGPAFLSAGRRHFVREIGYCPQFDAVLDELTGDEMLDLMAGLRGIPRKYRKEMIKEFVELVDLTECHKRQTSTYSGGNKRKLSTAMALVGGPSLVFLDEPTTGVDPASRRRVWTAIRTARSRGQSIILTSHSMDECEALCTRLVILVRGQLRCSGTPAHLKAKFSTGYSLQVKLRCGDIYQTEEEFDQALSQLMSTIARELPGSTLADQHRGMLSYMVSPKVTWSHLFNVMEGLKNGTEGGQSLVEDYAATDPSLEQVFLAFAREADIATAARETKTALEDNNVELVTVL